MTALCVYCSSADDIDPGYLALARDVGTRIAAGGHTLVSGGSRVSMMGELARAARAGGARTIGVMPARLMPREIADTDADELVVVDTMRERKRIMESRADAFLALPGGIGTLEELMEMWTSHSLGMHDKPVAVLDPDGFYRPFFGWLSSLAERGFVRPAALGALIRAGSVDEAFRRLGL
jgi:uncharacterized protein (TIGR00730 family)